MDGTGRCDIGISSESTAPKLHREENQDSKMTERQGDGMQTFWDCSYCHERIAINPTGFGDVWWPWPPKYERVPPTCPRCANYRPFVEQARLRLVEECWGWGYRQWNVERGDGWHIKVKIER